MSFKSNLVTGSSDAVRYPRMGMEIYIRAFIIQDDQGEIQGLYEESQARNGDAIAYELRREADMSSKFATRGLEMSYNGKFSSNGGIIDDDYHWAKSVNQARLEKRLPRFMGPRSNGVYVNEPNIAHRMDAVTGILFIPWCNGQVIQGYEGKGVLIKNDGYIYLQLNGDDSKIRAIPI